MMARPCHRNLYGPFIFQLPHPTRTSLRPRRQNMAGHIGTDPMHIPATTLVKTTDRRLLPRPVSSLRCTHI